ncbi:hypothetical protein GO495_11800 [Chitinophaga oryziterrae]|uniref:DUF4138 domain-containing protein n=1 Tax=Chitinophaga oryziterrae TaxID=1031224 RepID=A0A6N8JAJ0_9BACT|nr:hypothetical protein [Chitinophaga oryziterrae]MVT41269.1 hypothetical protein [Chitinophaga oryziterrae]
MEKNYQMKHALTVFCCLLFWNSVLGQKQTDSIITTKGAVTLITCGAAISTFQIGDGKNSDYDYRIVDGTIVFIRPIVANPRTTNLVIREGENIHYMILAFRDKADLSRLKYTLSPAKGGAAKGTEQQPQPATPEEEEEPAVTSNIDTVTVSRIASDFMRQKRVSHQYETTADGITLSFSQVMTLDSLVYFCFHIKNRTNDPYIIGKTTLMHKTVKDSAVLDPMPILYRKVNTTLAGRGEQQLVYVTGATSFKRNDEVIMVIYNGLNKDQVVLYTPVGAFPKYMISK